MARSQVTARHARAQRDRRPLLAALLVASLLFGLLPAVAGRAGAAAGDISVTDHEGQLKPGGTWSNGNITTYAEGEIIPFRFTVEGAAGTSGTIDLRFSGPDAAGCDGTFFDQYFALGSITPVANTPPIVTNTAPVQVNDQWAVTLTFDFSDGAGEAVVGYLLRVSNDVLGCNGSSTGTEFDPQSETGDVGNSGTQRVPVPAKDIVELPEITAVKLIDRDGDNQPDGTAEAGEYGFSIDGGEPVPVDASGQVVFLNVTPDGPHTITETQLSTTNGTYEFVSVSGTSCVADESGQATATVTASPNDPTHATCTFLNTTRARPPLLRVTKSPTPGTLPEPGGSFVFTVTVENDSISAAALVALDDDAFGDITQIHGQITQTDCSVPRTLAPSDGVDGSGPDSTSCAFTAVVTGDAFFSHTNTVTATASNERGSADASDEATVTIADLPPTVDLAKVADQTSLDEPGGTVTYTLTITNTAAEPVTITALTDDHPLSQPCLDLIGEVIEPADSATCSYTVDFSDPGIHTNTATVTVEDNETSSSQDSATATVTIRNADPSVQLDKSVTPASAPAPGGVFTFTLTVRNLSVEPVTITSLTDDYELSAECIALIGTPIGVDGQSSCAYEVTLTDVGSYDNTASVTVIDNEGNEDGDDAAATVTVTRVAPGPLADLAIEKSIVGSLIAGEQGTYRLAITNAGPSSATDVVVTDQLPNLASLVSVEADGGGTCLADGGLVSCTFASLAVGASAVITIVVDIDPSAANVLLINTGVVSAAETDPDLSNNTSTVQQLVPEVLAQVVTPTPAPTPGTGPTNLPNTGSESGNVAFWAIILIGLGALLLAEDRRVRRPRHGMESGAAAPSRQA